jgi:uncharacterized membrane protein (Fun14 family)
MPADNRQNPGRERPRDGDRPRDGAVAAMRVKKRPWELASVKFAIAVTVLGLALSIYALATRPASNSSTNDAAAGDTTMLKSNMAAGDQGASSKAGTEEGPPRRAVDAAAPATLRFGASFLGAFAIGYCMRKFLRWTLLIVGIAVVAIFFLRKSGMINLPWDQIEGQVHQGASWLQAQAGSLKKIVTGYLPSSFAAFIGGVIGFRRG